MNNNNNNNNNDNIFLSLVCCTLERYEGPNPFEELRKWCKQTDEVGKLVINMAFKKPSNKDQQ